MLRAGPHDMRALRAGTHDTSTDHPTSLERPRTASPHPCGTGRGPPAALAQAAHPASQIPAHGLQR